MYAMRDWQVQERFRQQCRVHGLCSEQRDDVAWRNAGEQLLVQSRVHWSDQFLHGKCCRDVEGWKWLDWGCELLGEQLVTGREHVTDEL